jgi:hypothetical protein
MMTMNLELIVRTRIAAATQRGRLRREDIGALDGAEWEYGLRMQIPPMPDWVVLH